MSKNNFVWAQDKSANIREPLKELSEKGWQHRDIPKASNMNWIFKQISDDFAVLRKDIEQKAEEFKNVLTFQGDEIKKQQEILANLRKEQNSLSEDHGKLKNYAENSLGRVSRSNDFNIGITRGICERLKSMEQSIRHYHKDFPEFYWPLHERDTSEIIDEGES